MANRSGETSAILSESQVRRAVLARLYRRTGAIISSVSGLIAGVSTFATAQTASARGVDMGEFWTGLDIFSRACGSEISLLNNLANSIQADLVLASPSASACSSSQVFDLAVLLLIIIAVIAVVRVRHATERRRLDLARTYIEQGMQPPTQLFPSAARTDLRKGIVLVALGLGVMVAAFVGQATSTSEAGDFAPVGFIPLFIGLGYLVSFTVAKLSAREE